VPGSNGGCTLIGNLLHHQPAARNPLLVEALTRLRLVNRSNLGVSRMYAALLMEGKEPPIIQEIGDSVSLTFMKREISGAFQLFVAEKSQKGREPGVDSLLILQHLLKHPEIETVAAAVLCQRKDTQMREEHVQVDSEGHGAGARYKWSGS